MAFKRAIYHLPTRTAEWERGRARNCRRLCWFVCASPCVYLKAFWAMNHSHLSSTAFFFSFFFFPCSRGMLGCLTLKQHYQRSSCSIRVASELASCHLVASWVRVCGRMKVCCVVLILKQIHRLSSRFCISRIEQPLAIQWENHTFPAVWGLYRGKRWQ